ncbi:MAG: DUF1003 domain-containing protein [Actinobacteria bacterium]|nr:DUF1003 domain-containing protein [Actinomycetota bacterium]NCU81722.1 DUF1003 domain-containing protein [Acidimicrobiia bacterium]HBQ52345.1 hypothetical protein [Acidimicrobium sp.]NBQ04971.1 DUF1003 domain-containing protein [Actinomycetota bacterium]NBQ45624.1 DUF1003 domain-containing protein [Actinomycetota bacterium]
MKRSEDLGRPRNQPKIGVHYNRSAFGEFAEDVARVMGTARFLVIQSVLVIIWVAINVLFISFRWDKYPFILLNLMFSVQAAYAAPLILLAHNRQESRDREQAQVDRNVANRTQNDAEFLAREIASVQLALANVVTADELREQIDRISEQIENLNLGDKKS